MRARRVKPRSDPVDEVDISAAMPVRLPPPPPSRPRNPVELETERDATRIDRFLCPTDVHRERMLDMGPRVARARAIAAGAMGAGLLAASPLIGWPLVPLFLLSVLTVATLDRRVRGARSPEGVVARSLVFMTVLIGVAAALTGGAGSPVLPLLVVPVAVTAARFRATVVWASAGIAGIVALAASAAHAGTHAVDHPLPLIAVAVLLVSVTAATTALMDAELQFRSQSVLDPLTGLLNRSGLEARFAEVAEQARLLGQPVCLIMCDLDEFKTVNDDFGHERGDRVLREVTYEMRRSLRSFELFYRLGGEEFLVLLPGIELERGMEIAEGLRMAVADSRPSNLSITASFGVSAATGRDGMDFVGLYRAADEALYRSKAAGRNLVTC